MNTEVARALLDRPRLTVVTNALNIAAEIAVRPNLKLVVSGGVARPESYELVGPIAEASLQGLNLDVVFLAVDGISLRAHLTTHQEVEAGTDRALIERAERVIVVADSSKVGKVAGCRVTNGTVSLVPGLSIVTYTAGTNKGPDAFAYTVSDGEFTSPPTIVTVSVVQPHWLSTNGGTVLPLNGSMSQPDQVE